MRPKLHDGPVAVVLMAGLDTTVCIAVSYGTAAVRDQVRYRSASVSGDVPIVGYEWTDAGTVLGKTAIITPTLELGMHLISLVVTDKVGLSDSDEVVVVVVEPVSRRR